MVRTGERGIACADWFSTPLRSRRLRRLELIQGGEDFGAVAQWIHTGKDPRNLSLGIDQECISGREFHQSEIIQRSIGLGDFVLGVGEQLEVQALFCAERFVRIDAVEADSQNNGIALDVLRLIHLELVGFAGSTGSLIFRIEVEDDPLAAIVR